MYSKCPLCADTKTVLWSKAYDQEYGTLPEEKVSYFECGLCEVIFASPMFTNRLNEIYPPNYYAYSDSSYNMLYKFKYFIDRIQIRKLFVDDLDRELRVLDIGGGTGALSTEVKKSFRKSRVETHIVDLDESARTAAQLNGHYFHLSKFENFTYDKKFDLILGLNILEHVEDPVLFLSNCRNLLSDSGKLIIQTPNYKSVDGFLFRRRYWGGLHSPRHFVIYSFKSLRKTLNSLNFKIIKQTSTQAGHFWACSVLGSLKHNESPTKFIRDRFLYSPLLILGVIFDFARSPFSQTSQQWVVLGKNADVIEPQEEQK
jgi:2-polyprenyl-3-methyl-5-hydroxy-6-metoxy-1,4-benzoquinol methylase